MFETICVGYDGSDPSENAVRAACDLAKKYDARVHIVHTPHPQTVAFAMGAVPGYNVAVTRPSPEEVAESASVLIERAQATAASVGVENVETYVCHGDAAYVLTEYAKSVGCDLIVTGRRGLGNLSALFLGSTALDVGKRADCAHLTVK